MARVGNGDILRHRFLLEGIIKDLEVGALRWRWTSLGPGSTTSSILMKGDRDPLPGGSGMPEVGGAWLTMSPMLYPSCLSWSLLDVLLPCLRRLDSGSSPSPTSWAWTAAVLLARFSPNLGGCPLSTLRCEGRILLARIPTVRRLSIQGEGVGFPFGDREGRWCVPSFPIYLVHFPPSMVGYVLPYCSDLDFYDRSVECLTCASCNLHFSFP